MRFSQLRNKILTAAVWVAALLPSGGALSVSAQQAIPEARREPAAQSNGGQHGVARRPQQQIPAAALPDSIYVGAPVPEGSEVVTDEIRSVGDSVAAAASAKPDEWVRREVEFTPNPTRAVWLSALFPGLGQIYNRRYWKLPIIVGGYMGLGYAVSWNNTMLTDYTRAYADLLDNDPSSKSYMDLFAPNVKEEDIDKDWLQRVLRSKKNYFRRNRDLCIICMVGVYLLAMVDAYVDASLSHFDISPDLSMDVQPALLQDGRQRYPSVGLVWALNF